MSIGDRIRHLRIDRRLTQGAVARQAGIAQNTLSLIELGRTTPSVPTIEKLAPVLDVPPGDLLEELVPSGGPNSLDELLERRGARTRHLANKNLSDTLERLPEKDVLRVAREVREEREALAEDRARLYEEFQRNPRNQEAFRLLKELVSGSLDARLAIAARMGQEFERVEPGTPEAEGAEQDVRHVAALVGVGSD